MSRTITDVATPVELYAVAMPTLPSLLLDATEQAPLAIEVALYCGDALPVQRVYGWRDSAGQAIPRTLHGDLACPAGWVVLYARTNAELQYLAAEHAITLYEVLGVGGRDDLAELWTTAYARMQFSTGVPDTAVMDVAPAYTAALRDLAAALAG